MIFASFYTKSTLYEEGIKRLEDSLKRFDLPYHIEGIESQGNWKANCLYRSPFIISVMEKYNTDVVWLDADAEVLQFPHILVNMQRYDLACYFRDGREMLLGTSYWRNNSSVKALLRDWVRNSNPLSPSISQQDFRSVLRQQYRNQFRICHLPEAYCHIFDKPITDEPVITHHQFSRQTRHPERVQKAPSSLPRKPLIHLLVNRANWAFDVRCDALIKYLSPFYDFQKIGNADFHKRDYSSADLTYFPTYEVINHFGNKCRKICGTVGGLVVNSLDESVNRFGKALAISIPNAPWFEQYKEKQLRQKLYLIPNGVDTELFKPSPNGHPFTIGWAGNDRPDRARIKRIDHLRTICKQLSIPLIERIYDKRVPHSEMPLFYNSISAYVNLSTTEGSNNPILEACASGLPVLGTPVGNMLDLYQSGAIQINHNLSNLRSTLEQLRSLSSEERTHLGYKLREKVIQDYSQEKMAKSYQEMFDFCLGIRRENEDT